MGSSLKLGFCGTAGGFFPDIVLLFLIGCVLLLLAVECLTFPATFFFILLFPCGPGQDSDKFGLWKSEDQLSLQAKGCLGLALYTQKFRMRQLHQKWCFYRMGATFCRSIILKSPRSMP